MKEQYIGDKKDYFKYTVIELLSKTFEKKIIFAWMLTPPDGTGQGNDIAYLNKSQAYCKYNPALYKKFAEIINEKNNINLNNLKNILENENYIFFPKEPKELSNDTKERKQYFKQLKELVSKNKYSIIFFDPDNGIEIKSCPKGTKNSNKFLYWDEILDFWYEGSDILVFQYIPLYTNHDNYIKNKISECSVRLGISEENISIIHCVSFLMIYLKHEPVDIHFGGDDTLKLGINLQKPAIKVEELVCKLYDNNNRVFEYTIDPEPYMGGISYSLATAPIKFMIDSDLVRLTVADIKEVINEILENHDICSLSENSSAIYYYDKHGWIYYCLGNTIYRFHDKSEYLHEKFLNLKLKLVARSDDNGLQLFNYGGRNGKWILKGDGKILEEGYGDFLPTILIDIMEA
jgi:hypothetical protein